MKKTMFAGLLSLAMMVLTGCSNTGNHVLQGTVVTENELDIALNYSDDGAGIGVEPIYIVPDSATGTYSVDVELAREAAPYELLIGENVYGVYLEKGKSLTVNITEKDGNVDLEFKGDNAQLAEYATAMYQSFDIMKYSPMDPSEQMPIDECFALLEQNHDKMVKMLEDIKDEERRAYFAEEVEYQYISMKVLLYGDRADQEGKDQKDYPEVAELLAKVDPNSVHALTSNTIFRWLFNNVKADGAVKGDLSGVCLEAMDLIEAKVTNPATRKVLTAYLPQYFFSYGDHTTGVEEFWARYTEFAKDYPDFIKTFEAEKNKEIKNMDGQQLPDLTLTQPDGKQIQLSSILPQAQITYVDVWATWCGPCCKEIPHLEKLVEAMKGNKKVQFVSMSVDADLDAWKAKLNNDKPQWAQYVLDKENNKMLSDALNITGIPRFFILDAEGNVLNQDAIRPSDPDLQSLLESLTK